MFSSYTPDRDYVNSKIDELKSLAKRIGVKLTKLVEELESYAETLEYESLFEHDEYDATIDDYDCNDQEIESIFTALKETS